MNGTMKFTPKARGPLVEGGEHRLERRRRQRQRRVHRMRLRPAVTASGSRGPADTLPMGASWIGSSQPSSSHTRFGMLQSYAPWAR